MLESYITPLLMSYVDKYIRNLKPSDLSLSLWGGDVVLYNLELRLDVLEKELKLPITFLSGKIHKLQIHIPWTKLGSEPVEITINTLECIVQLRYPDHTSDAAAAAETPEGSTVSEQQNEELENALEEKGEAPPSGYVQSLVNRVINNVSICVNNVILKYLEDDIVLSLNMKSAETFSVNGNWEKAFADVVAPDFLLQKVCNISDLTICLDKRSSSGKIELYQDPLLYKCGLSCRMLMKFDNLLRPLETIFNVYCESVDVSLTDQQLPMFMRLVNLCASLYFGTLDLPGCNYKPHPARRIVEQQAVPNVNSSLQPEVPEVKTHSADQSNPAAPDEDWVDWMWSMVPNLADDQALQMNDTPPPMPLFIFGIYVSQVTVTIKLTGKVSEGNFFGGTRFEFKPLLSFELSGGAVEVVMKGDEFFDAQIGMSSIMGWCIGDCVCSSRDESVTKDSVDTDDKEDMFLSIRTSREESSDSSGFLRGSLFDNVEESTLVVPKLTFNAEEFLKLNNEAYALKRYGAFFIDYLYTMDIEPAMNPESGDENVSERLEVVGEIRQVKELSFKRMIVGPTHVQLSTSVVHRMELVSKLSFEDVIPRREKSEPFYDEFVEKQLLAGNIASRHLSITLVSATVVLPAADHGKVPSAPLQSNKITGLHAVSSQHSLQSIQEQDQEQESVLQPTCILQINRAELQITQPMYPTELIKLTMSNAEYPAGKAMLACAYANTSVQVFGIQVNLSQLHPDMSDVPLLTVIPPFSAAGSLRVSILPATWGGADQLKREAQLEVPSCQVHVTKPQFLLLSHILESWIRSVTKPGKIAPVSKVLMDSTFHSLEGEAASSVQPELQFQVLNIEVQFCEALSVIGVSGSVGSVGASVKSPDEFGHEPETTPLIEGPSDTTQMHTGNLFQSTQLQENIVESTGPVASFTLQLPHAAIQSEPITQQGPLIGEHTGGVILFQLKGITLCLDPLLYKWISYKPPPTQTLTPSPKHDREKTKTTRHQSLTRTPSATTPRKKTFARGSGSVSSPAKEEKKQDNKTDGPAKPSPASESVQETLDGRKAFESWLFDKLPFITAMELQVDVKSVTFFLPETHVPHETNSRDIALNYSMQALKPSNNSFPPTLVICLPSLQLSSENHAPLSVRQSLPVIIRHRDPRKRETLPWKLQAENLAVYSVHVKRSSPGDIGDLKPVVRYLVAKVSSTAVLASAKTSFFPTSPSLAPAPLSKQSILAGRRISTLGFCVHTDFQPIEVSCSRKQMQLVASLLEALLLTCVSKPSTSGSSDVISGIAGCAPPTPVPGLKRTVSLTSSSALDQAEIESLPSESVSSAAFSQIQQTSNPIKVSLWIQWTLPRLVANLYSRPPSGGSSCAVCVSAELEDLTASFDYQDTLLQMQYKVGALAASHYTKSTSGSWVPGPLNGIILSCNDIISSKSLFTAPTRRSSSGRREVPGHGPHGFLTVMYKRSSLHLKRRKSTSCELASAEEDYFKDLHEVRVNVQPFDVVVWCPAIVAAFNTFDLSLLERFGFLAESSESEPVVENVESVVLLKEDEENKETVTVTVDLLPLLFVNMRNLRLFVPSVSTNKQLDFSDGTNTHFQEDMAVVQLTSVCASPHPDNPISRTVLNHSSYEKFRKFGRSSRQALGYDIHDVQYQVDMCGFGVWSGSWGQLCGRIKREEGLDGVGLAMDQNPALEWNTQMWHGTEEVHVTPIISGSDFRIVLAPAISVEKSVTVRNTSVLEMVPVCGWSLEFNVITDVDCFLNKKQIQLLQGLLAENFKVLSTLSLGVSSEETPKALSDLSGPHTPDEIIRERDRIDSGIESSRTDLTKRFSKTNLTQEKALGKAGNLSKSGASFPWEIFLTSRKLTAAVYTRIPRDKITGAAVSATTAKPSIPGRGKPTQIKPVLRVELVHPALIVNTQSSGPRIEVSCFDVSIAGASPEKGVVLRPLPEPSDYSSEWFKSSSGLPDPHSGILPSLLTVDITDFLCGPADVSVDLGRPVHMNLSVENFEGLTEFLDGLVLPREEPVRTEETSRASSGRASFLRSLNLCTTDMFVQLAAPSLNGTPKLLGSLTGVKTNASMRADQQGNLNRVDTRLQLHGVGLSTSVNDRCRPLIHPFSCSVDLETVWAPHSRDLSCQSGCGLPQLYACVDAGYLQIDFGQEHVTCLSLLTEVTQQLSSKATATELRKERGQNAEYVNEGPEVLVLSQSFDDIRAGCFRYVTASGELDLHHPEPWEIVFSSDSSDRPPTMTWRYPEPRALSAVELIPLPLTTPVLVNTLNMGDEYRVPCVLRYWDPAQKCYVSYKDFHLSENNATFIPLPDPCTADPSEVIVAAEWQIVMDVTVDIEYPDDGSFDEDDTGSSYTSPYRSSICATSLAASVKVNSVVRPSLNPALSAQVNVTMLEIKLTNHLQAIGQAVPRHLAGFTLDPFLPTDQEFLLVTVEGLSAVIKDVGGRGAFLSVQTEWNCHAQVLDYGDLLYRSLMSPFDMSLTAAVYHEGRTKKSTDKNSPTGPPVWLDVGLEAGSILTHVSQSTIHTVSLAAAAWGQTGHPETERIVFNHYVICNDTHVALRLGQVDTDESLLLSSRQTHAYSWRTPRSVKDCPRLHVCIETEGDWRWSEPFDIDTVGVFSRTIHHRLHSATLFIEIKKMSGVQKQVVIRGSHVIVSRLSIDVDVQILTNPSLNSGQSSKAPFQVLEDVSLQANTTLPSYVISHGGLAGMRIRIPNGTTWSDTLPLEYVEGDGKGQHLIVQLLGIKDFQTFHFWYCVDKPGPPDQVMVTLSPLFVMRSHLPEPVLMNVLTAKTNSTSVHQLYGRAREQQMYSLVPNSWHHLTFQFSGSGHWSSPSVPLNTTLIELANRIKVEGTGEEETPLADIWPYCGSHQSFGPSESSVEEKPESSLVRNVTFPGPVTTLEGEHQQGGKRSNAINQGMHGSPSSSPAIELQCRVVKRWSNTSSLLVDVLPWCLLANKTAVPLLVRDLERDVTIELAAGSVVAPHRITGKIQLGTFFEEKTPCWSEEVAFPNDSSDSRSAPTRDADDSLSASVAFLLSSGEIRGARWSVVSRMFRGIKVVSIEQRFQIINNVGKPLFAHPVLVATGKKMSSDSFSRSPALHLPDDPDHVTPVLTWDVPSSAAVVLNGEGNPSFSGQMSPVLFLAFPEEQKPNSGSDGNKAKWSRPVFVTPEVTRQSVAVSLDERSTHHVVMTSHVSDGVVYIVLASDPAPRLLLHNDCPFTLQFGQTIPPQSPSQVIGSSEKIVVMEQMQGLGEIPEVAAMSSTHYELPIMREWFTTSSEVQRLPELHIQALYDVNVAELSEHEGEKGELDCEVSTKVPQGWSKGLDLNSIGELGVNLPGRGQVLLNVSREHLCTHVRIKLLGGGNVEEANQTQPLPSTFHARVLINQFGVTVVDELTNFQNPYEVFRVTAEGIALEHTTKRSSSESGRVCPNFSAAVGAFQIDNQLQDDSYEFSVILIPSSASSSPRKPSSPRRSLSRSGVKPLIDIRGAYEPATSVSGVLLSSLDICVQPLTVYIEDTFLYRLGEMIESFLPPSLNYSDKGTGHAQLTSRDVLDATSSIVNPMLIGRFQIKPVTLNVTLHASVKLFLAVDDSPLSLGQFDMSPVFLPSSALVQKLSYHYVTAALFKAGWLLGSLELLGNPAGLVRSFSQGVADFFYLPYDGLTRGPGAFVSGMSRGMSSFVRHLSTGTLTSITSLASSMARNLDRLSMDNEHQRMLEEQRCRRPKKVLTGLSQGLGGFGLSLLGAVAGIVDQPIQGIRRANDVREAASGVITGVGKGLIGAVTKPLGGAMELVSQTGQGILQGAGLIHLPNRLFTPGERLEYSTRNSHLKYFWKMLHQQRDNDLLLHMDATVVTSSGHDYDGAVLLTKDTLYIVGSAVDAIQQTLHIRDITLQEDEADNRGVAIVNQSTNTKEGEEELDGLHDSNSGDVDRLKQFLRDARAQALAQMSPQDPSESGLSSAGQKFLLLLDPLLRRTLLLQFHSAKKSFSLEA